MTFYAFIIYETQWLSGELFAHRREGWFIEVEVARLQSEKGGKILYFNFSLRHGPADTLQVVNMFD